MKKLLLWAGLSLTALLLAACSPTSEPSPAPTVQEELPTAVSSPTATIPPVDYCLACHTDKDQLIDTAKPEEVVESESEGVG